MVFAGVRGVAFSKQMYPLMTQIDVRLQTAGDHTPCFRKPFAKVHPDRINAVAFSTGRPRPDNAHQANR
jgi:hypothetical protein